VSIYWRRRDCLLLHFWRRRPRTSLVVIGFGLLLWILHCLDHHRLCVGRLDYAFCWRRVCLPGKVHDEVGLRSVGLGLGNGRWEKLEVATGSGHRPDGRLMAHSSTATHRRSSGEWSERTPALINGSKERLRFRSQKMKGMNLSSTAPAWTCQT
jgi:hypothetical protein